MNDYVLGGAYGKVSRTAVCCASHRICDDCWWRADRVSCAKGYRGRETAHTRDKPLVENPRKGQGTVCFGCLYQLPTHPDAVAKDKARVLAQSHIDVGRGDGTAEDAIVIV